MVALSLNSPSMAQQRTVKLRIIETSDVHGSFFPYDFINQKPAKGSLARVSSYVDSLRQTYKDNLILLDNGDILQGQPTCYYYNYINTKVPHVAAEIINYMKYDAETMGNHDVETGHSVYDKWIKEVKCPMIGANVINAQTGTPYLKPYTLLYRDGVKIAILGMLTPAIPNWLPENLWSGLRFEEMVSCAKKWMEYLKENEDPDVVIGLFHSGKDGGIKTAEYEEDASIRVAKEVGGFDLVLFGHDHTPYSETITNDEGKQVVCLDPANKAMKVADAEITIVMDEHKINGKTAHIIQHKAVHGQIADVADCPVDQAFMQHFKPQMEEVEKYVSKKIGTCKHTMLSRESFFGSSAFNDFILNLMLQITHADIAFNAPLQFDSAIKEGPICVSDMFNLYKYENKLYTMKLTGEEIRKHLEMSYDLWANTMKSPEDHLLLLDQKTNSDQQRLGFKNFSFNFDSAAGINYEVDVTKPDGEKVKILSMSDGKPFDEKKWYTVAVNSYRGNGGGELLTRGAGIPRDSLESRIVWRSELDQRYYLMEEIEKMKVIDAKPNNNWKFVPEAWTKPAAERDMKLLFKK